MFCPLLPVFPALDVFTVISTPYPIYIPIGAIKGSSSHGSTIMTKLQPRYYDISRLHVVKESRDSERLCE